MPASQITDSTTITLGLALTVGAGAVFWLTSFIVLRQQVKQLEELVKLHIAPKVDANTTWRHEQIAVARHVGRVDSNVHDVVP